MTISASSSIYPFPAASPRQLSWKPVPALGSGGCVLLVPRGRGSPGMFTGVYWSLLETSSADGVRGEPMLSGC